MIYVIGSLQNKKIPAIAEEVRTATDQEVYDEWWCPGEFADQHWQDYCRFRGLTYVEALEGWHAKQVFDIDKQHLDRCEAAILVLPAGKSGHLELGYVKGKGKLAYILLDEEPDRYDLMYGFADLVANDLTSILEDYETKIKLITPDISYYGSGITTTIPYSNFQPYYNLPGNMSWTNQPGPNSHPGYSETNY